MIGHRQLRSRFFYSCTYPFLSVFIRFKKSSFLSLRVRPPGDGGLKPTLGHFFLLVGDGAAGDGGGAGQHQHAAGGDAGAGHFAGDVLQQAAG